ncbi:hypothetical protein LP420_01360 [Massilia sp. B-10]|nr:hypothetical protein LP420_01360 [Massilia sp. B-10]
MPITISVSQMPSRSWRASAQVAGKAAHFAETAALDHLARVGQQRQFLLGRLDFGRQRGALGARRVLHAHVVQALLLRGQARVRGSGLDFHGAHAVRRVPGQQGAGDENDAKRATIATLEKYFFCLREDQG